jgi:Domain of unknown function (DU1801)
MANSDTHGRFDDILAIAKPKLRPVCVALREQIAAIHPGFVEVVWPRQLIASFGVGPKKTSEHYAYIAIHGSHINLGFYHGTSLADAEGLLEGTGKELRHVKLRDVSSTRSGAIAFLLRQAIAERKRYAIES